MTQQPVAVRFGQKPNQLLRIIWVFMKHSWVELHLCHPPCRTPHIFRSQSKAKLFLPASNSVLSHSPRKPEHHQCFSERELLDPVLIKQMMGWLPAEQ